MQVNEETTTHGPYTLDDVLNNNVEFTEEELREIIDESFNMVWDPIEDPLTPEMLEEIKRDSIKAYSEIKMFDYGLGKNSNEQDIADFYGGGIVRQIEEDIEYSHKHKLEDRKPGQISKKLYRKMKEIREGKRPKESLKDYLEKKNPKTFNMKSGKKDSKPFKSKATSKSGIQVKQRERQKRDHYHIKLERGVILNETYRELFKGPSTVYEWIWANIVRDQWKDTKAYPIKEKYHDKGFLAYCSTYGKIAKECGMSKNTVHSYIKKFEEAGIIKTEPFTPEGKKQGQTVFILGTWKMVDGKRDETFYRDSVFITPKPLKK